MAYSRGHGTHSVILIALGIGTGQWFLLRRWIREARWWIPATVFGQAAGWGVAGAMGLEFRAEPLVWVASGLAQWLLLRRWVARAWWWLLAALVVGGSKMLLDWTGYWGLVSDVSGWAMHATISGAALWAVLRHGVWPEHARGSAPARIQGGGAAVRYLRYASMAAVSLVGLIRCNTGRGLPNPADPSPSFGFLDCG